MSVNKIYQYFYLGKNCSKTIQEENVAQIVFVILAVPLVSHQLDLMQIRREGDPGN